MEQLLHMATFCPPDRQYQHILPTTFWPKLLHLCAQGEKFSQIMKFVGVSYKASERCLSKAKAHIPGRLVRRRFCYSDIARWLLVFGDSRSCTDENHRCGLWGGDRWA
jgi:hypothetical protein